MRELVTGRLRPRRNRPRRPLREGFCKDAVTTTGYDFLLLLPFSTENHARERSIFAIVAIAEQIPRS